MVDVTSFSVVPVATTAAITVLEDVVTTPLWPSVSGTDAEVVELIRFDKAGRFFTGFLFNGLVTAVVEIVDDWVTVSTEAKSG